MMNARTPERGPSSESTEGSLSAQEGADSESAVVDEVGIEAPDVLREEREGSQQEADFETTMDVRRREDELREVAHDIEKQYRDRGKEIPSEVKDAITQRFMDLQEDRKVAGREETRIRKEKEKEEIKGYEEQLKSDFETEDELREVVHAMEKQYRDRGKEVPNEVKDMTTQRFMDLQEELRVAGREETRIRKEKEKEELKGYEQKLKDI